MFLNLFGLEFSLLNLAVLLVGLLYIIYILFVLFKEKESIKTKDITLIAVLTALSFVLSLFKIVHFPQGGGISLVQFLPLMLISVLTNKRNGIIAGIIFGLLNILFGGTILHPVQVIFDYIIPPVMISLIAFTKPNTSKKLLINSLIMFTFVILSFLLSGLTFFASYAPSDMNIFVYALLYNLSGSGVDLLITIIVLLVLPINRIRSAIKI